MTSAATALVLGGGGARGAFQVGVAQYLFEDLAAELGQPPSSMCSVGHRRGLSTPAVWRPTPTPPLEGVANLAQRWLALRLSEVVRPNRIEALRFARSLLGHPPATRRLSNTGTGLLNVAYFRDLLIDHVPFERLRNNLHNGRQLPCP